MASSKQVQIIARYTNKQTGVVSYLVRSSDGKSTYCTTLIDGVAIGCSCPARSSCYHKTQLEAKEAGRAEKWTAYRVELAKKLAATYMTSQVVLQIAEGLVKPAKSAQTARTIKQAIEAKVPAAATTDLSKEGELNTGRPFQMMR